MESGFDSQVNKLLLST